MFIVSAIPIDYKNDKKSTRYYVVVWVTLTVVLSVYSILIYQKFHRLSIVVLAYIVEVMVTGIYVSVLSIFSFFLHNVKIRFKVLNQTLR